MTPITSEISEYPDSNPKEERGGRRLLRRMREMLSELAKRKKKEEDPDPPLVFSSSIGRERKISPSALDRMDGGEGVTSADSPFSTNGVDEYELMLSPISKGRKVDVNTVELRIQALLRTLMQEGLATNMVNEAREELVALYEAIGEHDKAEKFRRKILT